jgi:predicted lipoprotein with Yx(FWY)xxD motif
MSVSLTHPFRPFLVLIAALALALAACSTDGGSSQAPASQAAASEEAPASEAPASAAASEDAASDDATVLVADSDLGEILTDAEGMTIYYFANDTEGTSNCTGDCLENWPPVVVDGEPTAGDGVEAELGTIDVEGETWLTVNGFPAYYFAGDAAAGDVNGQAVGDVWWVFGPDGEPIEE